MSLTSLPHRGGTLRRQESHPPCRLPLGARRPHRDPGVPRRGFAVGGSPSDHPVVGDLRLAYEVMELSADTGLTLTAYSPEPDSPSQDALALLASWAATLDQSHQHQTAHPADRRDP